MDIGKICCTILLIVISSCGNHRNIIIDERLSDDHTFEQLDTLKIFSSKKFSKDFIPENYKKFGDANLLIVKTKKYERKLQLKRLELINSYFVEAENVKSASFMFNGLEVPQKELYKLKALKPTDLSSVEVLSPKIASGILGTSKQQSVILINTYDLTQRLGK